MPETWRAHLNARLAAGEIRPADIPLSPQVTQAALDELRKGDDDPLEVVIEVAPGQSSRGWHYTEGALRKLAEHVQAHTLSGVLGHQRDEDLSYEFRNPATHWIGAKWDNGRALFRGLVDRTQPDLKRWIRSGRITQPSIFTRPTLATNARGEQEVVDLEPLSIDWAPLGRAGMETANVIAWGEMAPGDPPAASTPPPHTTRPEEGTRMTIGELIDYVRQNGRAFTPEERRQLASVLPSEVLQAIPVKELIVGRSFGELAAASEAPVADKLVAIDQTWVKDTEAVRSAWGEIAAVVGTDPKDVPATKDRVKGLHAEAERSRNEAFTATARKVVGEMGVPEALRPLSVDYLVRSGKVKPGDPEETFKSAWGEIRQSEPLKGVLGAHFAANGSAPRQGQTPPRDPAGQGGQADEIITTESMAGVFDLQPQAI